MRPVEEIPHQPYGEIVRFLLEVGAPVPERVGRRRAVRVIAHLPSSYARRSHPDAE